MDQLIVDLLAKLDRLADTLTLKKAPEIWSAKQIAAWMGLSESTVVTRVACRPGFPQPVVPTGTSEAQKRWFADEVIEWARTNRGTLPTSRPGRRRVASTN